MMLSLTCSHQKHSKQNAIKFLIGLFIGIGLFIDLSTARAGPWEQAEQAYDNGDYEQAIRLWRQMANQKDPRAQNQLGEMYSKGRGVHRDFSKAEFWFERYGCPICALPLLGRAYELAGLPDSALAVYELYSTTPYDDRPLGGPSPHAISPAGGYDHYWLPVVYERLADLYEQRGDTAKAIYYYGKLVDLWQDADPELQPRVEAARRAIEALSGDI